MLISEIKLLITLDFYKLISDTLFITWDINLFFKEYAKFYFVISNKYLRIAFLVKSLRLVFCLTSPMMVLLNSSLIQNF